MKKKIVSLLLIIFFISIAFALKDKRSSNEPQLIKIGISLPLSGEFAQAGEGLKNAVLMAQKDLNQKHLKYKYEILIENDNFEAKRTAQVINKFIYFDNVNAIISFASQGGNLVAPLAEKHRILHVNFAATDEKVTEGNYNFVVWTKPMATVETMLKYYEKSGFKEIVVITANNSGTLSLEKTVRQQLKNFPFLKFKFYRVMPTEKNFRMLLAEVKGDTPDAVLALIFGDSIYPFIKQYREQQLTSQLTNIEAFTMMDNLEAAEGVYIAGVSKANQQFMTRLLQDKPQSSTYAVGHIYDAVMMIANSYEKANGNKTAADVLRNMKTYQGITGLLIQDETGFFDGGAILEKVQGGQLVVIEK